MEKTWKEIVAVLGGAPYAVGGNGPDSYDCWGLVKAASDMRGVYYGLDEEGINNTNLALAVARETESSRWDKVGEPEAGGVCVMTSSMDRAHVGIVTPYGVLHTTVKLGAVLMPESSLVRMGYRNIRYYKWAG